MINSYLDSLANFETRPYSGEYSLENMSALLEAFGNPHRKLKFIHVAGTNGKGSVCMMLSSIFKTAGYNTGLYTSPHLIKTNERIKINEIEISDDDFNYYLDLIKNKASEIKSHPTFFDVLTIISIMYFADSKVDIAVMETGLGGRLDSTNVIIPICSVITDISFDHEKILGHTIENIASEKCGIVKKNIPVITTNTDADILSVIRKYCNNQNSELYQYDIDFAGANPEFFQDRILFSYYDKKSNFRINSVMVNHPSNFQVKNAAASIFLTLMVKGSFNLITESIIIDSMKNLVFHGRFEKLSSIPLIFFDPAHNIEAVEKILNLLLKNYNSFNIHIIFSLMADKNVDLITKILLLKFKNLTYFILDDPRAFLPGVNWCDKTGIMVIKEKSELKEYIACKKSGDSIFFFTGSFRLYGVAKEISQKINLK